MKLGRRRRRAGSVAAHNSQYGPQNAPTITAAQRDAIYGQVIDRLSVAGDLSLLAEQDDLDAVKRLARELDDDLRLLLDTLGWGETSSGVVELAIPDERLVRTFTCLRERAVELREASSREPVETQAPYERALVLIEACDQVLAAAGD
jgi:hypothetical protein